jgi:hypothetical protein
MILNKNSSKVVTYWYAFVETQISPINYPSSPYKPTFLLILMLFFGKISTRGAKGKEKTRHTKFEDYMIVSVFRSIVQLIYIH